MNPIYFLLLDIALTAGLMFLSYLAGKYIKSQQMDIYAMERYQSGREFGITEGKEQMAYKMKHDIHQAIDESIHEMNIAHLKDESDEYGIYNSSPTE